MDRSYDVVVVGGGAAGLSGALALARARRSVLVIDAGAPRNAPAGHVHNYLGREGTPPAELLAIGRAEVAGYGGEIVDRHRHVRRQAPGTARFRVTLADGATVRARRLLVTTGLVDELPDVPGLAERWGRDVLHCPYCHGWEVRDQAIGVLATGPLAVHQALLWRQWSRERDAVPARRGPDPPTRSASSSPPAVSPWSTARSTGLEVHGRPAHRRPAAHAVEVFPRAGRRGRTAVHRPRRRARQPGPGADRAWRWTDT